MKKYAVYIGVLAIGLLLGWLLFGGSSTTESVHNHDEVTETNQLWTCSMHPQIMQPEPGDCPICGMDLIPAETSVEGLNANEFKLSENAMALANIQTSVIAKSSSEDAKLKLSGKIVENEEANVVQASYFSGRIERLNVNSTGEEVKKGQLLATIYSPELFAAQQELITASALKESQPALYKAVRNKLKLWKISDNQIDQIEASGTVKQNVPIYATVSGTVSEKLVAQGDYVKQGETLLKIANLNTVWALFDVYENQIELFKKGQDISVRAHAYPNKEFKRKVDFIDPTFNSSTRTVKLRVVLNNTEREFKTGMFVEAKIDRNITEKEQRLMIPSSAVMWTGNRSVTYVKTNPIAPVFEMKEIVIGKQLGEQYEIIEGLKIGDEVVTNGAFTVDASAQLQGKKSMMNKKGDNLRTGHENHLGHENTKLNEVIIGSDKSERIEVSKTFQQQLKNVFEDYINLKNALVKEDTKKVIEDAERMRKNLDLVDMKLLSEDEAHTLWMSIEKDIQLSIIAISKASRIRVQRDDFKRLSTSLITAIQVFGINEKVFVEFCPMADKNKGAYWLSKEEKVINPYFGEAMLTCGEVKEVIE